MRILTLENSGKVYACQIYLALGGASRIEDLNTLVDVFGHGPPLAERCNDWRLAIFCGAGWQPAGRLLIGLRERSSRWAGGLACLFESRSCAIGI